MKRNSFQNMIFITFSFLVFIVGGVVLVGCFSLLRFFSSSLRARSLSLSLYLFLFFPPSLSHSLLLSVCLATLFKAARIRRLLLDAIRTIENKTTEIGTRQ